MEPQAGPTEWKKRFRLIFSLVYIAILVIAAIFLLPYYWYLWLILVLIVLTRFISWSSKKEYYDCIKCGATFSQEKHRFSFIPKASDLYGSEKTIKCPRCGSNSVRKIEKKR